jgi:hypothetical protein
MPKEIMEKRRHEWKREGMKERKTKNLSQLVDFPCTFEKEHELQ